MATTSSSASKPSRTRAGCQTCKKRRKRCDEKRPMCGACAKLELQCTYNIRLKWASTRDLFMADSKPLVLSTPWLYDALGELLCRINATAKLKQIIYSALGNKDREILLKFLSSGYRTLASDLRLDDSFLKIGFHTCEQSMACLYNCLTYQVAIDPMYASLFDEYYSRGLSQFREEMCGSAIKEGSLFFAGVFMCIISFNRLLPWTIHLNSMISLTKARADFDTTNENRDLREFISLLGFLDLPSHTLNRKTSHQGIWYTYRRGQPGIDPVGGLPFSLLDLLASINIPGIEDAFLSWTMPHGEPAQRCLWEATRLAGILSVFDVSRDRLGHKAFRSRKERLSAQSLVENILSYVRQSLACVPPELSHFKQALLYPLVLAASQRDVLGIAARDFICETIQNLASERNFYHYRGVLRVIREHWSSDAESIEDTARKMDIELALF